MIDKKFPHWLSSPHGIDLLFLFLFALVFFTIPVLKSKFVEELRKKCEIEDFYKSGFFNLGKAIKPALQNC